VCQYPHLTHSEHVIALHILGVLVIVLIVKFPEEIEGYNGVEIHHNRQQTHSQDQLMNTQLEKKDRNR